MPQYIEPMQTPPATAGLPSRGAGAWGRRLAAACRRAAGGRCAVCRGWCEGGLCPWCEARCAAVRPRCPGCAAALPAGSVPAGPPAPCARCLLAPPPWAAALAGVDYGPPWDALLAELKFHARPERAGVLLRPLLARLADAPPAPGMRLVPVPLARERLRERGYNQSWELARRLAPALGLEARPEALERLRDTPHQLRLGRAARDANLRGAFMVAPRQAAWLRGAPVALVDDVLTTGATARAAAGALLAAGAREVHVWVVARTP